MSGRSSTCSTTGHLAADPDLGPADLLQAALDQPGYLAELEAEPTVESAGRLENLGELVGSARSSETIDGFLEQVSLVADTDDLPATIPGQVVLMTLHSAKGLEFPVVFLLGFEDGIFPHPGPSPSPTSSRRSGASPTSASPGPGRLYISHAWSRSCSGRTQYNPPSRFFDEIPAHLIESKGNVGGRSSYGRQSYRRRSDNGYDDPPPYRHGGGSGGGRDINADILDAHADADAHHDSVVESTSVRVRSRHRPRRTARTSVCVSATTSNTRPSAKA